MLGMSAAQQQLARWVERNGPSLTDAVTAIGCQWGQLRDWTHGTAKPGLKWAVRIQTVTGIRVEAWLLGAKTKAKRRAPAKKAAA